MTATQMTIDARHLPVGKVRPHPDNVRGDLGDLTDLAASIREHGVQEPVVVYPDGDGWVLVFGHRRHAASKLAKQKTIPAVVRTQPDEATITEQMLVENLQRSGLDPIDEALGVARLHELAPRRTHAAIGKAVSRSTSWVDERLALAKLPAEAMPFVRNGKLTIGDAVKLATSKLTPKQIVDLAKKDVGNWPGARAEQIRDALSKQAIREKRAKAAETFGKTHVVGKAPTARLGVARVEASFPGAVNIPVNMHAKTCDGHRHVIENSGHVSDYCATPEVHTAKDFTGKGGKPGAGEMTIWTLLKSHKDFALVDEITMVGCSPWQAREFHRGCPGARKVIAPWSTFLVCVDPTTHDSGSDNYLSPDQLRELASPSTGRDMEWTAEEIATLREFCERTVAESPLMAALWDLRENHWAAIADRKSPAELLFDMLGAPVERVLWLIDDEYAPAEITIVETLFGDGGPLAGNLDDEQASNLAQARERIMVPEVVDVELPDGDDAPPEGGE